MWVFAHFKLRITHGFCELSISFLLTLWHQFIGRFWSWSTVRDRILVSILSTHTCRNLEHRVCVLVQAESGSHWSIVKCQWNDRTLLHGHRSVRGDLTLVEKGIVLISDKTAETRNFTRTHADMIRSLKSPHSSQVSSCIFLSSVQFSLPTAHQAGSSLLAVNLR